MSLIIRELSAGEIASKSFGIYRKHFWIILAAYFPLGFTTSLLARALTALLWDSFGVFAWFGSWLVSQFVDWVATVLVISVVSDVCLGHIPNLRRAYKRITPAFIGKLLITKLVYYLALAIGLALFLIPALGVYHFVKPVFVVGLVPFLLLALGVYLIGMFHMAVLVVEGEWGGRALKRSKELGKDYYLRNLWVMLLLIFPYILLWLLSYLIWFVVVFMNRVEYDLPFLSLADFIFDAMRYAFYPVLVIRVVLLYYDMRVRKEAFDYASLAEELTF